MSVTNSLSFGEASVRIALSFGLGSLIGIQRELDHQPAGLRTHLLVTLGSTLFTLVSAFAFEGDDLPNADPSRIAAQIVSGIGFLGGGAILKEGRGIHGLTTAATLWVCAGIGMACALFFWYVAILITVVVLFVLEIVSRVEKYYWSKKDVHTIKVKSVSSTTIGKIFQLFAMNAVKIRDFYTEELENSNLQDAIFTVELPKPLRKSPNTMINIIVGIEGVSLSGVVLLDGKKKTEWQHEANVQEDSEQHGKQFVLTSKSLAKDHKRERRQKREKRKREKRKEKSFYHFREE